MFVLLGPHIKQIRHKIKYTTNKKYKSGIIMKNKKAIQTIVPIELYDLLFEVAELDNKSVAQLLRDLLVELAPGLKDARYMILSARKLEESARKLIIPDLERHGKQLESNVRYGLDNMKKTLEKETQDPPQYKLPL